MDAVDRFLNWAEQHPASPALVIAGEVTSYGALRARALAFAAAIQACQAASVLIALPKCVDAYAAMLGCAIGGAYYTPVSVASPADKLRRVTRLLAPDVIVADAGCLSTLGPEAPHAVCLTPESVPNGGYPADAKRRHRLAYVMFTSGSTGQPKGVMVPRTALDNYVDFLASFGVGPADRVSQYPSFAFDISLTDMFAALSYGGALYPVITPSDRLMPARFIRREAITVWNSTPSVLSLMMQARQATAANLGSVRLFNFCGEPLLADHVGTLFAAVPGTTVQNTYGPTETTVAVTCQVLRRGSHEAGDMSSVALGDPLPGVGLTLKGGPDDQEGEIVVSGRQLAEGYWADASATQAAFREAVVEGRTVLGYHTGDWARRRDGRLYFCGRIGNQVKVRGHRVELEEVASAVRACGWPVVAILKRADALVGVVERVQGRSLDAATLRLDLARTLEPEVVPEFILETERMPRNDSDKLDVHAVAVWIDQALSSLGTQA